LFRPQQQQQLLQNSFGIQFGVIEEFDENGLVVKSVNCSTLNFTVTQNITKYYTVWDYSTSLSKYLSGASPQSRIQISIYSFNDSASLFFANNTLIFSKNSLKVFVSLESWPFSSIKHSLRLTLSINAPPPINPSSNNCGQSQGSSTNNADDTKWVKISGNDYSLFVTVFSAAEVDGRVLYVTFSTAANNIFVHIPYFWSTATVDPDFVVLFEPPPTSDTGCYENIFNEAMPQWEKDTFIAVAAAIFVAIIGVAVYVIRKKRKMGRRRADISLKLVRSTSSR